METFAKFFAIILLCLWSGTQSYAQFYMPGINQKEISSVEYKYPEQEVDVDVIWRYRHSIQLEINELQMDGQSGDFLLISDLPLTFEESFIDWNNSGEVGLPPFFADSVVTSHGILLSWELKAGAKFQILSKHGTFIYFHAEGKQPSRGTFPYKGFNITVIDLDEQRIPPTRPTTEGTKAPPAPEVEIYMSRFLKNDPFLFRNQKNKFKTALAIIATTFCVQDEACGELLTSNFTEEEINIPTDNGLRMCEISWELFDTCVEVTFAITKEEDVGGYVMPKWRLEHMWSLYGHLLEDYGFIPYDDHPGPYKNINTWMWMAGILGIILFLMVPMCIFWIVHELENQHLPRAVDTEEMEKKEENEGLSNNPWRDLSNPIRPILAKLKRQSEDTKYLEVSNSDTNSNNMSDPPPYKPKTKTNVLFQEQDVTFEYDNKAYLGGSAGRVADDGDEIVLYGHGHDQGDFMDIADEEFPVDRFLTIERTQYDGHSDTEI